MEDKFLTKIIEDVSEASKNVKSAYYVLATFSVIFLNYYWNALEDSWLQCRITIHQNQMKFLPIFECKESKEFPNYVPDSIPKSQHPDFFNARKYYNDHSYNKDILQSNLVKLNQAKIDNLILIKLPIINIWNDINDLALVSGITFIVLLIMLIYNLIRKFQTLDMVCDSIKKANVASNYKYFAYIWLKTNQILTIKPKKETFAHSTILRFTTRILYNFPLVLFGLIVFYDLRTFDKAVQLNINNAYFNSGISILLFIIIGCLTVILSKVLFQIDNVWRIIGKEAEKNNPPLN